MQSKTPRDKKHEFLEAVIGSLSLVCFFFGLLMIESALFQPYSSMALGY